MILQIDNPDLEDTNLVVDAEHFLTSRVLIAYNPKLCACPVFSPLPKLECLVRELKSFLSFNPTNVSLEVTTVSKCLSSLLHFCVTFMPITVLQPVH
jgi:hypothetical protein